MTPLRVLVGVLNYNAIEDCIDTVRSLRRLTYPAFDLLIVDNASTNDAAQLVAAATAGTALESNAVNSGYAGGMNSLLDRGVARGYDYVLLCNNDIDVGPDALDRLVATAQACPDAAVIGGVELAWQTGAVRCVGGLKHGLIRSRTRWSLHVPESPQRFAFPQGALLLVDVAAVKRGLRFDDGLFMYFEEADIGFRLHEMGRTAVVDPGVRIRHKADARHLVPRNGYLQQRNRVRLVRRHGRPWQLAAHLAYVALLELPAKVIARSLQGHLAFARACLLGFVDGVRGTTGRGAAAWL
ncbi:MAG TPA: glycosyltransferase family 2 protein [Gemmatimonadales bacterium]|jgi:hypothetical protein